MTDPVFALVLIVVFFALSAGSYFFRTLEAMPWRKLLVVWIAAAMLPLFIAAARPPHSIAILMVAAALYVRLTGGESEAMDGMILGGCTGAAAAAAFVVRGENELLALSECIAAGAVAGYGITFAADHVRTRGKQIAIDAVTALAAIAIAYAPRAIADVKTMAVAAVLAVPLLAVASVFQRWRDVRGELRHEASLGFIDDADVRLTAHPILRLGGGGWADRHAHRELVRLANEIALRKRRQRHRPDDVARLYQLEIIKLRMQIQEMSRIDRAVRNGGGEVPSDTMAHSK